MEPEGAEGLYRTGEILEWITVTLAFKESPRSEFTVP
jgi:hypothetical protein